MKIIYLVTLLVAMFAVGCSGSSNSPKAGAGNSNTTSVPPPTIEATIAATPRATPKAPAPDSTARDDGKKN